MAAPVQVGCFSSSQPLSNYGYYKYQSSGYCAQVCTNASQAVLGLSNGTLCFCGNELPVANSQVPGSNCNTPCQGYDLENCGGGTNFFTVWLTGLRSNVQNYDPSTSSSTTSSSTTSSPTTSSTASRTGTRTSSPSATDSAASASTASPSSSSSSGLDPDAKLGVILGVVLGVLAIAIMLVIFWCLRRRRKRTGNYFHRPPSRQLDQGPDEGITALPRFPPNNNNNNNSNNNVPVMSHLRPPPMAREGSQATSYDQPFYTPAERPSYDFPNPEANRDNGQEVTRLPTLISAGSTHSSTSVPVRDPNGPPSIPQIATQPPIILPTHDDEIRHQRSWLDDEDANDHTLGFVSQPGRAQNDAPGVHYPSRSEVNDLDFFGAGKQNVKGSDVSRYDRSNERKTGRYELP